MATHQPSKHSLTSRIPAPLLLVIFVSIAAALVWSSPYAALFICMAALLGLVVWLLISEVIEKSEKKNQSVEKESYAATGAMSGDGVRIPKKSPPEAAKDDLTFGWLPLLLILSILPFFLVIYLVSM